MAYRYESYHVKVVTALLVHMKTAMERSDLKLYKHVTHNHVLAGAVLHGDRYDRYSCCKTVTGSLYESLNNLTLDEKRICWMFTL